MQERKNLSAAATVSVHEYHAVSRNTHLALNVFVARKAIVQYARLGSPRRCNIDFAIGVCE